MTAKEFEARRGYYLDKLKGVEFLSKSEDPNTPVNPLTDPSTNDALMNMAKGNLMSFVPQTVIMGWVNFFFAGAVVMRLPFPLTEGFKSMLQNGVNSPYLNARYVSAISWYFVNLFGLRPLVLLILGEHELNSDFIQANMNYVPTGDSEANGMATRKLFEVEAESIQILEQESIFVDIAERMCEL